MPSAVKPHKLVIVAIARRLVIRTLCRRDGYVPKLVRIGLAAGQG